MRSSIVLLPLLFAVRISEAKTKKVESPDSGELEDDWNAVACSAYESCLQTFDSLMSQCGLNSKKAYEDDDLCYVPIAKQYLELMAHKEKRNKILRKCFVTGKVRDADKEEEAKTNDLSVGKRKKSTCRHKIAELEQFERKFREEMSGSKKKGRGTSMDTCRTASRRFKDKCQKIESCCIRVKDCRRIVSNHPVVEKMKVIENELKEERRECKEHLKSERFFD